jgi:hypothetical protein
MNTVNAKPTPPFDCRDDTLWRFASPSTKKIAEHIGREATVALCMAFGGMSFTLPIHENANRHGAEKFKRLVEVIGADAARKLCAVYARCGPVSISNLHAVRRAALAREATQFVGLRVSEGLSQRAATLEAVSKFGLSSRAIEINLGKII